MSKASYIYNVESILHIQPGMPPEENQLIVIEDLGGDVTVTNDMEAIIKEIATIEKIDSRMCLVIYKDTDNTWDAWDTVHETFIILGCVDAESAINRYREIISISLNKLNSNGQ